MPVRNDPGMATPTSNPDRMPSAATMIIMTRRTAEVTLFWRSLSMSRMPWDLSCEKFISTPGGQVAASSFTRSRTRAMVSMIFSPVRFDMSSEIAGLPLALAKDRRSLKERLMLAISRMRTTASPLVFKGIQKPVQAHMMPRRCLIILWL